MRLKCSFERAISHYDVIVVYKCCLQDGKVVAKDSGVVTTNGSCPCM